MMGVSVRSLVMLVAFWCLCWCPAGHASPINITVYKEQRELFLSKEKTLILGQNLVLSVDEEAVNDILMTAKMAEMNDAFHTLNFLPAKNFLNVIGSIQTSEVFRMIERMPKGAGLHVHDTAMASLEWVVEELTYWPDLYMCFTPEDALLLKFFDNPDSSCSWQLLSDVRASYLSPEEFDAELYRRISIVTDNPDEDYPDLNSVWAAFDLYFMAITDLLMYRPAWEAYLYRALDEFRADGVLYLEFRGTLPPVYEKDGTVLTPEETLVVYEAVIQRFVQDHMGDFLGARFIYAPLRAVDNATIDGYVDTAIDLYGKFPDLLAGFDLVGQEDLGQPLIDVMESLLRIPAADIPVFYHAGETDWMGMSTDENIIDALLLNTTRVGHGYAIVKHPKAMELALTNNIPMEVCPISNQVLKLVADLRNHPAAHLVAEGFPIVISSDDPGAWGAKGISYDFYEAFMAFGGAKADLRFLKQLAINSIMYSSVDEDSKSVMMQRWQEKWDSFINSTLSLHTNTIFYHRHQYQNDNQPQLTTEPAAHNQPSTTNTTTTRP